MGRLVHCALGLALLPAFVHAEEFWNTLRTPHFELITDAPEGLASGLLIHLEHVRRLFLIQAGAIGDPAESPVRVVAFRSPAEYARYRLDDGADAYYFGVPGRDYIVMSLARTDDYRLSAHEYAHVAIHRGGLKLPLWLSEGIAEVFSTVTFRAGQATVGYPSPGRLQALNRTAWMPMAALLSRTEATRHQNDPNALFYAQSWALTHMLMFSPVYSPRLSVLLGRWGDGLNSPDLLREVYGVSPATLERDLRQWVARPYLPAVTVRPEAVDPERPPVAEPMNSFHVRLALAELRLTIGQWEQARSDYRQLENEFPANPDIQAALGRIALAGGRKSEALDHFGRALSLGIRNAQLCYQFAVLGEDAGLPGSDVLAALERAVALDAGMDDARYLLALTYMNAGRFDAALRHFRALRFVSQRRAFAYFTALAHTENELGLKDAAAKSAAEARKIAHTEQEAEHAGDLAWIAASEIVVQMTSDKMGRLWRVPRQGVGAWNPFIEPTDRIERQEGELRQVECSAAGLRLLVAIRDRLVVLSVAHPERVQVTNTEGREFEFTCGPQSSARVKVEYAVEGEGGALRGISFLN